MVAYPPTTKYICRSIVYLPLLHGLFFELYSDAITTATIAGTTKQIQGWYLPQNMKLAT